MKLAMFIMRTEVMFFSIVEWISDLTGCWRLSSRAAIKKTDAKLLINKLEKIDN